MRYESIHYGDETCAVVHDIKEFRDVTGYIDYKDAERIAKALNLLCAMEIALKEE